MSVSRLQVTYKSPEVDEELDRKILEFFNTLDFVCIDRAYHSIIFRRDIFFEKHAKDVGERYETQYHLKPEYLEEKVDENKS